MTNLYPEFFRRLDEGPDELFYERPRPSCHIDQAASRRACRLYDELLPAGGEVLDLMAGETSHLPDKFGRVVALGLNLEELRANPQVDEPVIFDLNRQASLPFCDEQFDGVVCTASVQYMTRPGDTFAEVARCLKPGAPFVVTFSVRMFPSKAVLAWRSSDDSAHVRLVASYFHRAPGFGPLQRRNHVPSEGDPLYALWASKERERSREAEA
ncbi:MAG TPA: methyltransferase domain-containing protein [Trueperaceae bacterium]